MYLVFSAPASQATRALSQALAALMATPAHTCSDAALEDVLPDFRAGQPTRFRSVAGQLEAALGRPRARVRRRGEQGKGVAAECIDRDRRECGQGTTCGRAGRARVWLGCGAGEPDRSGLGESGSPTQGRPRSCPCAPSGLQNFQGLASAPPMPAPMMIPTSASKISVANVRPATTPQKGACAKAKMIHNPAATTTAGKMAASNARLTPPTL